MREKKKSSQVYERTELPEFRGNRAGETRIVHPTTSKTGCEHGNKEEKDNEGKKREINIENHREFAQHFGIVVGKARNKNNTEETTK